MPQYWSKEVIDVYSLRGNEIFQKKQGSGAFVMGLIFFLFVTAIGSLFYFMGKVFYDNDEVINQFEPLEGVIACQKSQFKHKIKSKDETKFYKKYRIHIKKIIEIAEK